MLNSNITCREPFDYFFTYKSMAVNSGEFSTNETFILKGFRSLNIYSILSLIAPFSQRIFKEKDFFFSICKGRFCSRTDYDHIHEIRLLHDCADHKTGSSCALQKFILNIYIYI